MAIQQILKDHFLDEVELREGI